MYLRNFWDLALMILRTCAWCSKSFEPQKSNQVHCSAKCRKSAQKSRHKTRNHRKDWVLEFGVEWPLKPCVVCGTVFDARSTCGKATKKTCSPECSKHRLHQQNQQRLAKDKERRANARVSKENKLRTCWYCETKYTTGTHPEANSTTCSTSCARHKDRAKRFKLTRTEYLNLSNACEICGRPANAIDHCHKTEQVRGHLCLQCNSGLGFFKDSIENLTAAILYLKARGSYG